MSSFSLRKIHLVVALVLSAVLSLLISDNTFAYDAEGGVIWGTCSSDWLGPELTKGAAINANTNVRNDNDGRGDYITLDVYTGTKICDDSTAGVNWLKAVYSADSRIEGFGRFTRYEGYLGIGEWSGWQYVGTYKVRVRNLVDGYNTFNIHIDGMILGNPSPSLEWVKPDGTTSRSVIASTPDDVSLTIYINLNWEATPSVSSNLEVAKPGDTLKFTYSYSQNGPASTDRRVTLGRRHSGGDGYWNDGERVLGYWNKGTSQWTYTTRSDSSDSRYIRFEDVGKTFCAEAYVDPYSKKNPVRRYSSRKCVKVAAPNWHMQVETTVSGNTGGSNEARPGDRICFSHKATNVGPDRQTLDVTISGSHNTNTKNGIKSWNVGKKTLAKWDRGHEPGLWPQSRTYQNPQDDCRNLTNEDVGNEYCATTYAKPRGSSGGYNDMSEIKHTKCVKVPFDYRTSGKTEITVSDPDFDVDAAPIKGEPSNDSTYEPLKGWHAGTIANAYPGDQLMWRHTMQITGNYFQGTWTGKALSANITNSSAGTGNFQLWPNHYPDNNYPWGPRLNVDKDNPLKWIGSAKGKNSAYTVRQNDVGRRVCEHVSVASGTVHNVNPNSGTTFTTQDACINTPYHYPACASTDGCSIKEHNNHETDYPRWDYSSCTYSGNCPSGGGTITGGIQPDVAATSENGSGDNNYVLDGDKFTFTAKVKNSSIGPTKTRGGENVRLYVFLSDTKPDPDALYGDEDSSRKVFRDFGQANCTEGTQWRSAHSSLKLKGHCVSIDAGSAPSLDKNSGYVSMSNKYNGTYGEDFWEDADPGDHICGYVAVNNWAVKNGVPVKSVITSRIQCVDIAKKPHLKILGADSYAADGVKSSSYNASNDKNKIQGSWTQYGMFSDRTMSNFGTNGYTTVDPVNIGKACKLGFANISVLTSGGAGDSCNLNAMGNFQPGSTHNISLPNSSTASIVNRKPDLSRDAGVLNVDASGNTKKSGAYRTSDGSFGPSRIEIKRGVHVTVYVDGDVTINGDIVYGSDGNYKTLDDIPSLTIVASGDLTIANNVKNLDGVYIAGGNINGAQVDGKKIVTCTDASLDLSMNGNCNNTSLTVRGAIISAASPSLNRVFGGGDLRAPNYKDSSEILNYTPNTFLVPYYLGNLGGDIEGFKTTSATSLPPRY